MAVFQFTDQQTTWKLKMEASYVQLLAARDAFIASLKKDNLPAWSPSGANARNEAAALYGDFFFPNELSTEKELDDEGSHPNVVSKGCGVIGASDATIELGKEFNAAKVNFDKSLAPMRGVLIEVEKGGGQPKMQMALDRAALKACRIPVLSERQACRRILILETIPEKIGFLWGKGTSTNKIPVAEVRSRLNDMTVSPDVASDLRALGQLDEDEPLIFVKELNAHLRVNIGVYAKPDFVRVPKRKKVLKDKLLTYTQYPTSMPILIPMIAGQSLPDISAPRGYPGQKEGSDPHVGAEVKKKESRKRKLEQMPYLKTLNIYRYQENLREEERNSAVWRKRLAERDQALAYNKRA